MPRPPATRDNLHVNITNLHLRLRSVSFIRLVYVYVYRIGEIY